MHTERWATPVFALLEPSSLGNNTTATTTTVSVRNATTKTAALKNTTAAAAYLIDRFNQVVENATRKASESSLLVVQPTDRTLMGHNYETMTPIVLEKYKLVLFTNPKCGSTVLKQLMRRMMGHADDYFEHRWGRGGLPHKWPANGLNYTAQYPIERVNEMMTDDAHGRGRRSSAIRRRGYCRPT